MKRDIIVQQLRSLPRYALAARAGERAVTLEIQWGTYGQGDGQFLGPRGVVVDPGGNVFVADNGNSRVQKFGAVSTGTARTSWGRIKALYR